MRTIPTVVVLVVIMLAVMALATVATMAQSTLAQATGAQPGVNAATEEEIKALETKLADLMVHGAWDEYEKLLAPDYAGITYNGKLENKEGAMLGLRNGPRKVIVMEPEDLHVRTYGETAVLQGQLTIWARESGRVSTKVERFTEVFVRQDGHWHLAAMQETPASK